MTATDNYYKLGLFVAIGTGLIIAAAAWLGLSRLNRPFFESFTYFDEPVDGLTVGSPVKFRGVVIGSVANIRAAKDRKHVEVRSHIYEDVLHDLGLRDPNEPEDEKQRAAYMSQLRVQLVRSPLTGVAYIQSDFFDPNEYPPKKFGFATESPMVHSIPSTLRRIEEGLMDTLTRLPGLVRRTERMLSSIEKAVDGGKLPELSDSLRSLARRLERAVDEALGHPLIARTQSFVEEGDRAMRELRGLGRDTRELVVELRGFASELRDPEGLLHKAMRRVDRALASLDSAAGSVGAAGQTAREELRGLQGTLRAIRRLAEQLERDPASLLRGRSATRVPANGGK